MYKLSYLLIFLVFLGCKKKDVELPPPAPPVYTPIKLNSSSFVLGNLEKGAHDTFSLQFNKPVTVNYIIMLGGFCLPDITRQVSGDGSLVQFSNVLCANLGHDYKFEYSVRDAEGKTLVDSVSFSYYNRKMPVEGTIVQYLITEDNNYCWVSTKSPNRIYCFGIEDTTYKKVYDIGFIPGRMTINPYDHKLYILNFFANYDDMANLDKIYVMNMEDGMIGKAITIQKDQYDDPGNHIVVYDLAFGYNGYGVILTGTIEYGKERWRIIDSRYNDTTYAHPEWIASTNGGNSNFDELVSCQANNDKTKIYLQTHYSSPIAAVLDCNTGAMAQLNYPDNDPNHYIVPSKTEDKLFIASFSYQGIIGVDPPIYHSQFDDRYSATADFSYRNNEKNIIYYRNGYSDGYWVYYDLMILNYNSGGTIMRTNVGSDFEQINATTNGKYVLTHSANSIFVYRTDWLYKYP